MCTLAMLLLVALGATASFAAPASYAFRIELRAKKHRLLLAVSQLERTSL